MEIRLIDEKTNLEKALHELDWDVRVDGVPYKAFFAYEEDDDIEEDIYYVHSSGGRGGDNYTWACPRNEKPTVKNLVQFDGVACQWGIRAEERNVIRDKWDEASIEDRNVVYIMRNGEVFNTIPCRDLFYGIAKAQSLIEEYKEHSLELNNYEFDKKCIGRKIRYHGIPAYIKSYCTGQAAVLIAPLHAEDKNRFFRDHHNTGDEYLEDAVDEWKNLGYIKVSIMSEAIWWFCSEPEDTDDSDGYLN